MADEPQVWDLNQRAMTVIGNGWRVNIRIVGWWRPRLLVRTYRDPAGEEILVEAAEWIQRKLGAERRG
jgi:hypothetical protein